MSTLRLVERRFDARPVLESLIGKTIQTLTGRPNKVLGMEGDKVGVATSRSPKGTLVPIAWVQDALDRLARDGKVKISVESVGYRSAFLGRSSLARRDGVSPATMRVRLVDPLNLRPTRRVPRHADERRAAMDQAPGACVDDRRVSRHYSRLKLRRPTRAPRARERYPAGELAVWDSSRRQASCLSCESAMVGPPGPSEAGASASREYERRRANREARVRERFGALGGVVLAVSGEPQHQRAWARGAEGEVKLARKLEKWTAEHGVVLLHDRRMPASRGNIDHIAIGPSGVTVIDAKRYRGRIAVEHRGGLLRARTEHLRVGGREQTKLVDGVLAQAEAVRQVLEGSEHDGVTVRAALCFVDGDWPLLGRLEVRGVPILPPRHAAKLCRAEGPLDPSAGRASRRRARPPAAARVAVTPRRGPAAPRCRCARAPAAPPRSAPRRSIRSPPSCSAITCA